MGPKPNHADARRAEHTRPLKVHLVSLGCPKNLVDSERMMAILAEGGCIVGAPMADADAIVINTCAFLSAARDEALAVIQEALAHKRARAGTRVVVAGCLPSRDGESLYRQVPGIDAVVGVNNRDDVLAAVLAEGEFTRISPYCGGIAGDAGRFRLTPRHTAFLRIAEGCWRRCSYCAVPAIRGPFRSKPPEMVLAEAKELVADGAVELNLIAQETTAYGRDLTGRQDLPQLLRLLDEQAGAEWIRLMYAHPQPFGDKLIDALAECRHVVPYVDIPLQHVCEAILRRMNRGATRRESMEALLRALRGRVEGIVLRTTFIVGFPGETDEQFEELLGFVRDSRFDSLGVFEFSPEPGTSAAKMPNQVPVEVKAERARRVMLAQQEIAFARNQSAIGKGVTVLIDGLDDRGRCVGRHYGQAPEIDSVCIVTSRQPAGTFLAGKVVASDGYDLVVSSAR